MDFQELRKEYEGAGIQDAEMLADPIDAFRGWVDEATDKCPGRWFEANAMTLATSDRTGYVTARVVLLKGITETGIKFYTNYESTKGKQLADNPRASVAFHWPYLGRQVRMEGAVAKTSREDSEAYFHSRPRGSQLGAAASHQSSKIESRSSLEQSRTELGQQLDGVEIPLPESWGGYELTAHRIEFWQGRLDRLHDRFIYEQGSGDWKTFRISP